MIQDILNKIKFVADMMAMHNLAANLGLSPYEDDTYYVPLKATQIESMKKDLYALIIPLLPTVQHDRHWEITASTEAKYAGIGKYYPAESFYRLDIKYTGNMGGFYFRSCTYHFTEDMKFVSLQYHCNDNNGWEHMREKLENLFVEPVEGDYVPEVSAE